MAHIRAMGEGRTVSPVYGSVCLSIATLLLVITSLMASLDAYAGDLDRIVAFNINARTLDEALLEFGAQAHLQIVFTPAPRLRAMGLHKLHGDYTGQDALRMLLQGTALHFVQRGKTIAIVGSSVRKDIGPMAVDSGVDPPKADPQVAKVYNSGALDIERSENLAGRHVGQSLKEVVVTGSHIPGAPQASLLIKVTAREIDQSGYTTVGDVIRSLPENFGNASPETIIGSAPNANQSPSGGSAPNLLGLGTASTLTLVDGQRLAADSLSGAPDISLIPLPAIDHIDVLTGGASAIYGSDAVAGVVNIVLKKDFSGARTEVLGGGTADGGGTEKNVNQMLGRTWSTGGAILDYEFNRLDPISAFQRPFAQSAALVTTLLPGMSRQSFFATAHQNIGSAAAFVTGLYTHRTVRDAYSDGPLFPTDSEEIDVHQYATTGGLNFSLPSAWALSIVGDFSEQRTVQENTLLPGGPSAPILYEGQTRSSEATANGPLLALPPGVIRGAIGVGYRIEAYNEDEDGSSLLPGKPRSVRYGYAELAAPLLKPSDKAWRRALVLNVSGRYERYSDFGDEFVPRLGLVYAPFGTLEIRGTWGKAFQAPSLDQLHTPIDVLYLRLADPLSPTHRSNVLEAIGGNPRLRPQTAKTWTLGMDYRSRKFEGLSASITYFDLAYRDLIGSLSAPATALTDPLNAPFVTRAPSAAEVESLLGSAAVFLNLTGSAIDPSQVVAIVNRGSVNISSEDVVGADVGVNYRRALAFGEVTSFADSALLDLRQKVRPGSQEFELSGRVFEPVKVRARAGVSWEGGRWGMGGVVNYTGSEINTYQSNLPRVASWTTADFHLVFRPVQSPILGELSVSLSVENAFNRVPPFVQFDQFVPGIHYDPLNANPLGRVLRGSVSWMLH